MVKRKILSYFLICSILLNLLSPFEAYATTEQATTEQSKMEEETQDCCEQEDVPSIDEVEDWKALSCEELDDVLFHSDLFSCVAFLKGLTEEDLEYAVKLSPYLNSVYTYTDEDGVHKEAIYYEFLLNHEYNPNSRGFLSKSGYVYVVVTGDGNTSTLKLDVTISHTGSSSVHNLTWGVSGTNVHGVTIAGDPQSKIHNGYYSILPFDVYYNTPAGYTAYEPAVSGHLSFGYCFWDNAGKVESWFDNFGFQTDRYNLESHNCTYTVYFTPNTYSINYYGNGATGGSTAPSYHTYNEWGNLSKNGFTRKGYTFRGWSVDTGEWAYQLYGSYHNFNTFNPAFYANAYTDLYHGYGYNFAGLLAHYVAYGVNEGRGAVGDILDDRSLLPDEAAVVNMTHDNLTHNTAYGLSLYAQWERTPYTVTYDANGGSMEKQECIKYYDEAIDLSLTAEKTGYIFVGWNTDPAATTGLSSLKMQEEDITLYAIYSIPVSDIANHFYDENGSHNYTPLKEQEVFLRIWEWGNETNYRDYPLEYTVDTTTMVYRYIIDEDVAGFVQNINTYGYAVYAYDNAGNWAPIDTGPIEDVPNPSPQKYEQTVKHYRYDCAIGEYIHFATTVEDVEENESFKPLFITPPNGYRAERMEYPSGSTMVDEDSYIVRQSAITRAYYEPLTYTLTFDANGGTTSVNTKTVRYGDYYGDMPTPARSGYTFMGWYTKKDGGDIILSSDKYQIEGDSTLYAHWNRNSYMVTYDYWTNGGTSVSLPQQSYDYGAQVDLSVTAGKSGTEMQNWTFVGWNTDASATTGLSSYTMTDCDMTLYAIYKKDIKVTLVEQRDTGSAQKTLSQTIYNNESDAVFQIANSHAWSRWTLTGWTTATGADEIPMYGNQATYNFMDNITLYALYVRDVTLSYDTNGSSVEIAEQTKEAYHNAAGNSRYPTFVIASAPEFSEHSFVNWKVERGIVRDSQGNQKTVCEPGILITISDDTLLTATWDAHPKIEAYNSYFTLDQARNGFITEAELLRKVKATDEEAKSESNPEGILKNGRDVLVIDFTASSFTSLTSDSEVQVTYEATDSFGNVVTKTLTITVTDTELKESPKKSYVRFISRQFLIDEEGNLIPESKGGLSETSTWRTNDAYRNLLINTLSNSKTDVETWVFTRGDIEELKKKL